MDVWSMVEMIPGRGKEQDLLEPVHSIVVLLSIMSGQVIHPGQVNIERIKWAAKILGTFIHGAGAT